MISFFRIIVFFPIRESATHINNNINMNIDKIPYLQYTFLLPVKHVSEVSVSHINWTWRILEIHIFFTYLVTVAFLIILNL